jgi:hypothetical protein
MKKAKITNVEILESWSNSYGTFYPHKVTFDNGDVAIANKVTEHAYTIGQELTYELNGQDKQGNNRFKEVEEQPTYSGGNFKKGGNASFALSYAKDIAVAYINNSKPISTNDIIIMAKDFNEWLNNN